MANAPAASPQICCNLCQAKAGCVGWSLWNGTCYMKSTLGTKSTSTVVTCGTKAGSFLESFESFETVGLRGGDNVLAP